MDAGNLFLVVTVAVLFAIAVAVAAFVKIVAYKIERAMTEAGIHIDMRRAPVAIAMPPPAPLREILKRELPTMTDFELFCAMDLVDKEMDRRGPLTDAQVEEISEGLDREKIEI